MREGAVGLMVKASRRPVCLAATLAIATAPAAAADLHLVSSRANGTKGAGLSFSNARSVSADGSRMAFQSLAPNLVAADPDTSSDIFVKDLSNGALQLASTGPLGKSNGGSFDASLSADGTVVAFSSSATNLSPQDGDPLLDIYVKDLVTGTVTLASVSASGVKGSGRSDNPSLSADGRRVAFESRATNLDPADPDATADIYVKDLATGALTLASRSAVKGNGDSTVPALAGDGGTVAFQSRATNLDPGDTDTQADIYVASLMPSAVELVSKTAAGAKGASDSFSPSLSADGNRVAFHTSSTNLDPADTDVDVADVYVKDRASGALLLASTTAAGLKAASFPFFGSADASLSADGTRVGFESAATNLDPADTDPAYDIYVKDLATAGLRLASITGQGVKANGDNGLAALGPDGSAVGFVSAATNLDPADTDTLPDIYLEQTRGGCADFSGSALGDGANPRALAGYSTRVVVPAATTTAVRVERGIRGLLIGRRAVVELPLPARRVAVRLAHFAQPVEVTAVDGAGAVVASATMTAPQATPETLALKGAGIVRLTLIAPADEALLLRLCSRPLCTITGTDRDDTLTGTPGADVICGRGGDDDLIGQDGNDRIYGGAGRDRVRGGRGADELFGMRGADRLAGERGDDRMWGGPQHDRCAGGQGTDAASGCETVSGVP